APPQEFSNSPEALATSPLSESLPGRFVRQGGTDRWATRVRATPLRASVPNKPAAAPSPPVSPLLAARWRNRHTGYEAQGAAKPRSARTRDKYQPTPAGTPGRRLHHRISSGEKSGISDDHTRSVSPRSLGAVAPL